MIKNTTVLFFAFFLFADIAIADSCPVQRWNHFNYSEISRIRNGVIEFGGEQFSRVSPEVPETSPLEWWSSNLNRVHRSLRAGLRQGIQNPIIYQSRNGDFLGVTFVRLTETLNPDLGLVKGAIRVFGAVEINGRHEGFIAVCGSEEVVSAVF